MRPVLAVALVLALAGCKKGPTADSSPSPTTFEWSQASPDGRFELRQRREAGGCNVQAVSRPDGKQVWTSRTCLPAPSGLVFLSPTAEKLLVLDLFPSSAEGQSQDWSKVTVASLWTAGAVSRQYSGAELLSRDRVTDMRAVLSWLRGETYDQVRAAARTVAGGTQVSMDLADGRTILLGFDGAALPTPPAISPRAAVAPPPEPPTPAAGETTEMVARPAAGEVTVGIEGDSRMYRWEDDRGELHFAPGADVPARYRRRAVPVSGNVGVVTLEKVQGSAPARAAEGQPAAAPAGGGQPGGGATPAPATTAPAPGSAAAAPKTPSQN